MKRKFSCYIIIAFVVFFGFLQNANAAPYTIDINFSSNLNLVSSSPIIFSEHDVSPGDRFDYSIIVNNNTSIPVNFYAYEIKPISNTNMVEKLNFKFYKNNILTVSGNNTTILDKKIDVIQPGNSSTYTMTVIFDPNANNQYQNSSAEVEISFKADTLTETETPAPTPSETTAILPTPNDSNFPETGESRMVYYILIAGFSIILILIILFIILIKKEKDKKKKEDEE